MSGDYSRLTFDPRLDFSSVLLQQGRPLTDADWDEAEAQTWRRIQAGTWDTFSQSVVPQTTPSGFEITLSAGKLTIGRGRIYVDGLLAENHGAGDAAWDVRLAETFGGDPIAFEEQPYAPGAPSPPESGEHVAFVDVWLREVTQFERPELVEPAIGVDTTARLQTAWQVRLLEVAGAAGGIVCATPDDKLPGWAALIAPSAGRLSIGTGASSEPSPCLIPPSGGYKGLENQLYRIEIHTGGAQDVATFKWSRDNASVAARVLRVVGTDTVIVDSVGKDSVLRFNPGDWIEIVDDVLELGVDPASKRPRHVGQLYRIADAGVDDATRALTLEPSALGLAAFPADAQGQLDPARHTRVRRWDHRGTVRRADGSVWFELDTSDGEIPLPPAGTQLQLESGILVSFDLDGTIAGGEFHSGDWWVCAARAGDAASVETLDKAPPRGVHHHYTRLAIVTFPAGVQDCRVKWPLPSTSGDGDGGGGDACCCTVCVSPEQHSQGQLTLQKAIDMVKLSGGTVCLLPGTYTLKEPLHILGAHAVTVTGQGAATVLEAPAGAFQVLQSTDVWLHDLAITGPPEAGSAGFAAIAAANVLGFTVERLEIGMGEKVTNGTGILLAGVVGEATLRENRITAPLGVVLMGQVAAPTGLTLMAGAASVSASANLVIDDNLLQCVQSGIRFDEKSVTQLLTRLRGNRVLGCHAEAVLLAGLVAPGAAIEIAGNHLTVLGDGIVCGPGDYRIVDNGLVCTGGAEPHEALSVRPGKDEKLPGDYHIVGNHATGFLTAGIAVTAGARTVLVKQNRTERCGCGVRVEAEGIAQRVIVDNNVIVDLAPGTPPASTVSVKAGVRGIAIRHAGVVHVADNVLNGVDPATKELQFYSGIQIAQCERATVTGNDILGPPGELAPLASGILVHDVAGPLQIAHNTVRRLVASAGAPDQDASLWMPLGIASKGSDDTTGGAVAPTGAFPSTLTHAVGALAFTAAADLASVPSTARPLVAVIGNELEGGGRSAVARVSGAVDCQFTSNHCVHLSPEAQSKGVGDVQLAAVTVIAAQNRVFGGEESLDIHLASAAGLTVLGNIARGQILVNGVALPPPWQPFNVQGV